MQRPSRLARVMARYAFFHQDPVNTATHFVGVPMITYSLLVALACVPVPVVGDGALVLILLCGLVYLSLDLVTALLVLAWVAWLYARATAVAAGGGAVGHFLFFFLVGWAVQLFGHLCEGRKPALTENLLQVFVAPLFVTVEALQLLGLYSGLRREVDRLVAVMAD